VSSSGHGLTFGLALSMLMALQPASSPALSKETVSFAGKTITIIIGSTAGGTTDTSARLIAAFLSKHLPGTPSVIVQSRPGAHSVAAMNYFAQQVKPDGLTAAVGSAAQLDPQTIRLPQSQYDPTKFVMVGGADLGGGMVIMRNDAHSRLTDKTQSPVVVGSSSGLPSSTILTAAWGKEYLGWNLQWVSGYPSATSGIALALQRGEIDMTGFSTAGLSQSLFDRSKYTVIYQTGSNRCSVPSSLGELAGTPLFASAMKGKIADPLAQKAFDYWCNSSSTVVWMALPPGTPAAIIEAHRAAFGGIAADPAFLEQGRRFSQEFSSVPYENLDALVSTYMQMSPEVTNFMQDMLRRQGRPVN
jgi:tripartite-type tricarboxylate transporter receptor subunit TctC